jgi:hypothetical protein
MEPWKKIIKMRRPLLLISILILSYTQSDLLSPNPVASTLFPLISVSAFFLLIIILIRRLNKTRARNPNKNEIGGAYLEMNKKR